MSDSHSLYPNVDDEWNIHSDATIDIGLKDDTMMNVENNTTIKVTSFHIDIQSLFTMHMLYSLDKTMTSLEYCF